MGEQGNQERPHLLAVIGVLLAVAAYRLAPHPYNVAPVGALFALSGFYLSGGWRGLAFPAAATLFSDALLYWRWDGTLWHPERAVDYLALILIYGLARSVAGSRRLARIGVGLAAPLLFFLVSNLGVWALSRTLYPHTLAGLEACYLAALPFLQGTVAGDLLFIGVGVLMVEGLFARSRRPTGAPQAA